MFLDSDIYLVIGSSEIGGGDEAHLVVEEFTGAVVGVVDREVQGVVQGDVGVGLAEFDLYMGEAGNYF